MSPWRQLLRGTRSFFRRADADRDLADEVRDYVERTAAAEEARGMSPDEALRVARVSIGNATVVAEQVRTSGWESGIETLIADVRYTVRRLRSSPGFATVAVTTLALGIGTSTAIFSAIDPILFQPLPYPHAERLLTFTDLGGDGAPLAVTFGTFREVAARSRSFDALAVAGPWQPTITGNAHPERADGQRVSASYFHVLGVAPRMGRDFAATDDWPGAGDVAIISDALWRRRFGADSAIIGRQVSLDDTGFLIIGVMPAGFENVNDPTADLWTTLKYPASPPSEGPEWGHNLRMFGRLKAGVSIDGAKLELAEISRQRVPEFARPPWAAMRRPLVVSSMRDDITRGVKPALLSVLGAVALLLVIACVNVANLLLVRGTQRRGELTLRLALGADAKRLVRQLLTESVVLALIGGILGIAVAEVGVRALIALSPPGLPRIGAVGVRGSALIFAFGVSAVVGILVGIAPALHASREDVRTGLQQGTRRAVGGHAATRRALVVIEVALALVLLVSAGLLFRSLRTLFSIDPGFAPSQLLTMHVQASGRQFADDSATFRFFAQSLDAVRRVPGVTAAAYTSQLPLSGDGDTYGAHFESSPTGRNESAVFRYAVSPGYFSTIGIPLIRGRLLDSTDRAGSPLALVINASFAKRKFPVADPIGQRLHVGPDRGPWYTIVGVVGDVKQLSLAAGRADAIYIVPTQSWFADAELSLVVRTRGDPVAMVGAIENAVWSVDKNQPITRVRTMDALVAASEAQRRFALMIFEVFALAALVLAAIGLYGVLAGSVTERLRELGVRAALGASPREIVALVIRQGMILTLLGVTLGVVGAAAASRGLITLLYGVSRLDPLTYGSVVAMLVGVGMIACALPAIRASRVDPASTLRSE
jgi:putative ABC transport system permease protein